MTMFSGGVNHPDHQIHINNNRTSSSSSTSSYAFDGASCFFHPINHHRLINYHVLQQQGYENFNRNSCFTTPPPHHNQAAAASAACGLTGTSSSSTSDPPPPCNHNPNYSHLIELIVVDSPMADIHHEDESRTETDSTTVNEELGTTAVVAGASISKDNDHIQIMHVGDDDDKKKDIQDEEEEEEEGEGWLQLSIGSCSHHVVDQINDQTAAGLEQQVFPRRRRRRSVVTWGDIEEEEEDHHHHQFLELDLFSPGQLGGLTDPAVNPQPAISIRRRSSSTLSLAPPNSSQAEAEPEPDHRRDYFPVAVPSSSVSAVKITNSSSPNNSFMHQQYHPGLVETTNFYSNSALPVSFPAHFQDPWALRSTSSNNIIIHPTNYKSNINIASSSLMPPAHVLSSPSYFTNRPSFQFLHEHGHGHGINATSTPTFGIRVVDPPRRPHSGVWFMLQAALIQSKEPFLPQIPKSYLRIKDGRMTVQFIIKYLVDKLRLDSEAEIEIRCRGQQLVPFLTVQHVRDSVWMMSPSSTSAFPSSMGTTHLTSTSDHLMVLHYGRRS